jgi:hypothetical protein
MHYPKCQIENPDGKQFCSECGANPETESVSRTVPVEPLTQTHSPIIPTRARKYITDAIQLFEECEADVYLKQARETLASLG